jgi:hypothetical protein
MNEEIFSFAQNRTSSFFILTSSFKIGGLPRICTVFRPVKSRSFTVKVCNPNANTKTELNRHSQVCEALTVTGVRVAKKARTEAFASTRVVCLKRVFLCARAH